MDGSIALRWPRRLTWSRRTGLLVVAAATGAFVAANVFAFHLGAAAGRAAATVAPVRRPVTSQPSAFFERTIRVLLLEQVGSCQIGVSTPFEIIDPEDRRVLFQGPAVEQLTIQFDADGVRLMELEQVFSPRVVDLVPAGPARLTVATSRGDRIFTGSLRLLPQTSGVGSVINIVDIEEYLLGVVPAEALRSFHTQALRAQAIAARTYAWYARLTTGLNREWDVWSTETSQMYTGLSPAPGPAEKAVQDTRGIVCTWNSPRGERIFCTYYSSTCGGSTQDAGPVKNEATIRPLAGGVRCEHCSGSPFYRWEPVRLDKSVITQRLRDKYSAFRRLGLIDAVQVVEATPAGRPVRFALFDKEGRSVDLEAENFRLTVDPTGRSIRSTFFVPVSEKNAIVLTEGRGFGHGMGMCQYGAAALADAGWQASQILQFYYPGSQLTRAY